jgi:hypothetical protein
MPVRSIIPDSYIVLTPLEPDLIVVVLRYQLEFRHLVLKWRYPHSRRKPSKRTYVEEISKNEIRFIFSELDDSLCETFIHEYTLPARDS